MGPIRQSSCACVLSTTLFALIALAAPVQASSASGLRSGRAGQGKLQIASPVLVEALNRLEGTRAGARIARFIRKHVRRLYFFDPTSPLERRYARYDGVWERYTRVIGVRNTLSGEVTDYLVSVLAHEGTHAMHASATASQIARISTASDYASFMIDDEARAYRAQVAVWQELRARRSPFERMLWADYRDRWMGKVRDNIQAGKARFRRWLEHDRQYGRIYRQNWDRLVQAVKRVKRALGPENRRIREGRDSEAGSLKILLQNPSDPG